MLSLFSSLFPAQRISLAGKYFRIALFSVFCALVIAPSLPAQAQLHELNVYFPDESIRNNAIGGHVRNIPANAAYVIVDFTPNGLSGSVRVNRASFGSFDGSASASFFNAFYGSNPGLQVRAVATAYDSNNNRVGYGEKTIRLRTLEVSMGPVGDFYFKLNVTYKHSVVDNILVTVKQGGSTITQFGYQSAKSTAPFIIRVGNLWDSNFDPSRSKINPSTTYDVRVESIRGMQSLGSQSFTVTTVAERICHKLGGASSYQNCPKITIDHQNHSATSLEFIIDKVSGASYYKLPSNVAASRGGRGCEESRDSTLGPMIKWWPEDRFIDPSKPGESYFDQHIVRYCGLRPNSQFNIPIVAYGLVPGMTDQYYVIAYGEVSVSTLAENTGSGSPQQLAPPPTPSPTAIPPVAIQVDYHGNHDTAVTLSWDAPGGYPAGYVLQVVGGNNEGYVFHLGRKETSQRVNGLSPGADYTAYLTAYLRDGGKRKGTTHFGMADAQPTNTPIPPTATPIPQQSSQDSVQQQDPQPLQYSQMQAEEAEEDEPQPSGPYASLITTLIGYQGETQHGDAHVLRWTRALAALGWGSHDNPMTLSEAKTMRDKYSTSRWQPVVDALTALQPPTATPIPPPTATPIPPTPIPPTPVPPTPIPPTPVPAVYKVPQSLINTLKGYQGETQHGDAHVLRWTRALAALGSGSHNNPMTLSEAEDMADKYTAKRWQPVIDALEKLAEN